MSDTQQYLPGLEPTSDVSSSQPLKPSNRFRAMNILNGEDDVGVVQTPGQMLDVLAINLPDHTAQVWEKDGIQFGRVKVT